MIKFGINTCGAIRWQNLVLMHVLVAKFVTNKVTPDSDSISLVLCASGNVYSRDALLSANPLKEEQVERLDRGTYPLGLCTGRGPRLAGLMIASLPLLSSSFSPMHSFLSFNISSNKSSLMCHYWSSNTKF